MAKTKQTWSTFVKEYIDMQVCAFGYGEKVNIL